MAKGAYIGVNGVARKNKGGYVGVNSVARKIKKGYIGVNGVARTTFADSYVLDGTFRFNDYIELSNAPEEIFLYDRVLFTFDNGTNVYGLTHIYTVLFYELGSAPWQHSLPAWEGTWGSDRDFQTVTFDNVEVPEEFYTWFIANSQRIN